MSRIFDEMCWKCKIFSAFLPKSNCPMIIISRKQLSFKLCLGIEKIKGIKQLGALSSGMQHNIIKAAFISLHWIQDSKRNFLFGVLSKIFLLSFYIINYESIKLFKWVCRLRNLKILNLYFDELEIRARDIWHTENLRLTKEMIHVMVIVIVL